MTKSLILTLALLSTSSYALPGSMTRSLEEKLTKSTELTENASALDDLMTPDEIAAEIGLPTQEEKWMNGDYSELLHKTGRTSGIENRPLRIEVIKEYQVAYVYQYGQKTHQFLISTGRNQVETSPSGKTYRTVTPSGVFDIDWMTSLHKSNTWDADMPYAMFFNGGIALHATFPKYYESLGRPTGMSYMAADGSTKIASGSGGCVRFKMEDAKIIFDLVTQYKRANTVVIVHDRDPGLF